MQDPKMLHTSTIMANKTLHKAAKNGDRDALREALNAGADVNSRDDEGNTALHKSVAEDHAECVKILLEHEAKNVPNLLSWTPLHSAAFGGATSCLKHMVGQKGE